MKKIRIYFTDFWPDFDNTDNFLYNLLAESYDVEVSEDAPDYLFYSVFGTGYLRYDCVRIFYTGENIQPDFQECDYAIGFNHTAFGDRYVRYPIWCLYKGDLDMAINHALRPKNNGHRGKFCNFIYSNSKVWTPRDEFFMKLSGYKKVDSGGRHMNNINGYVGDKISWCSGYRFSIAFENSSTPGYATEKILQAFASNTIPVYFGDPEIARDFNTQAFINCHEYRDFDEVISRIAELDSDKDGYMDMLGKPALNNGTLENIEHAFRQFLSNIFEQDLKRAYRRGRPGAADKKERVVVWGAGGNYEKYRDKIGEKFEIAAVTSSYSGESEKFDNYIDHTAIGKVEYDHVLIFSNYDADIANRLVDEMRFPHKKILLGDMVFGGHGSAYFPLCNENAVMNVLLNMVGMSYEEISKVTYMELGTKHPVRSNYTYPIYQAGGSGVWAWVDDGIRNMIKISRPRDLIVSGDIVPDYMPDVLSVDTTDAMPVLEHIDYDDAHPMVMVVRFGMWGTKEYRGNEVIRFLCGNGYTMKTNNGGVGVFVDIKQGERIRY